MRSGAGAEGCQLFNTAAADVRPQPQFTHWQCCIGAHPPNRPWKMEGCIAVRCLSTCAQGRLHTDTCEERSAVEAGLPRPHQPPHRRANKQ